MTATNHALTGAVIALAVKKPELAIPLAFAIHFVMDALPHFDAGPNSAKLAKPTIFVDVIIATSLTLALSLLLKTSTPGWLIFASALACMSPDLVWGWRYYKLRDFRKIISEPMSSFSRFHQKIQWSETRRGILVEIFWFILFVWLIYNLAK